MTPETVFYDVADVGIVAIVGILTGFAIAIVLALLRPDEEPDEDEDAIERARLNLVSRPGRKS